MHRAENLIHCVYASTLAPGYDQSELVPILAKARRTNGPLGATGILLYSQRAFFQVLEGPPAAITGLYRKIALDPRHVGVVKLIEEPIEERCFRDWTMGLVEVTRAELSEIAELRHLVDDGASLADIDPTGARGLLAALSRGRFRMHCETAMVTTLLSSGLSPGR